MLWRAWGVWQNASPLLLMCKDANIKNFDDVDGIKLFAQEYSEACATHAKQVSFRCKDMVTVRLISDDSKVSITSEEFTAGKDSLYYHAAAGKSKPSRQSMVNARLISDGSNIFITTDEYLKNKDILYTMHNTGKPTWNSGGENPKIKGKVSVYLKGTTERVFITTSEYFNNNELYTHPLTGCDARPGFVPAFDITLREYVSITKEVFASDKDRYLHPSKNKHWYNNGIKNLRIADGDNVPEGYVEGRLPGSLKGHKKKTLTCPHCNLTGGAANMIRYGNHFDNCASKPTEYP